MDDAAPWNDDAVLRRNDAALWAMMPFSETIKTPSETMIPLSEAKMPPSEAIMSPSKALYRPPKRLVVSIG